MPYHLASRLRPGRLSARRKGLLRALVLTFIFSLAPILGAQDADDSDSHDSDVRIVRVSHVDGEVRMDSGHGWENLTINVPVTERNWLRTGSDGWAEIQFEDGSLFRLAPDSRVIFSELEKSSSGGTVTTIKLDMGEVAFEVAKRDDSDFRVMVKDKTVVLAQSATFRVSSTGVDPMDVVVFKGEALIRDPESGDVIAVKRNQTFVLAADLHSYALEDGADADALDEWSQQRDDYLSRYGAEGSYEQSPYQYGASDLIYYGDYYDLPGYGYVWQPNGVDVDWDPFSNGFWYDSPGFGYAWVSAYRWGWLPFRYGHWVFVKDRGWCWVPGRSHAWHTGPRWLTTNAPPGFHPPVRPANRKEDRKDGPKIVIGGTGHVPAPGIPTSGGRRIARDRDDDAAPAGGKRGTRRVLTNDDVQTKALRSDVPQPQLTEPKPAIVDKPQQPEGETVIHRGDTGRFQGDRERVPVPSVSRSNDKPAAPPIPSQPGRQYNPPPQSYSPPASRQENPSLPPAPQVHRSDSPPPAAPVQHSSPPAAAPVEHPASPAAAPTNSAGRPH